MPDHARLGSGGFLGAVVVSSSDDLYRDVMGLGASYGDTPPLDGAPAYHGLSAHFALRPLHVRVGRYLSTLARNGDLRIFDAFSTSVGYRATF